MEIGTEISRKIRSAIKGKLQELGAYVDEELPDYIMVMVANKKSQDQMTEDLSLFLGNNTIRFTVWLHGVLDKLRSVTTEPSSLKSSDTNIFDSNVPSNKSNFSRGDERRHEAAVPPLAIPSARPEKRDSRVSTSSQESKTTNVRQTYDDGAATRLMSTVKPLREPAPSEDVIDIKPEPDDLIDEDLNFVQENPLSQKKPTVTLTYGSSRPSIEIYRPPASRNADSGVHLNRLQFQQQQNSIHAAKQLDMQSSWVYETGRLCEPEVLNSLEETYSPFFRNNSEKMSMEDENFRKRKLPVVSSVVKVKKFNHDGEEEEEDDDYGSRTGSISSSVSVPAKPERRPSLPPSKQANKNLILKAISEAQESVTKTTNYSTVPQKQTLPVAPRTRTSQEELLAEVVQGQSRTPRISPPIKEEETKGDSVEKNQAEMSELSVAQKPEKLLERCKYWPACKNGDECAYHHPISPCKAFPNCKFAEKCLFVHPNCKYDAKCTKPDCPFTHVSRRIPVLSPKPVAPPAPPSSSQLCRYFPACKKMECPFYHPKHCRFNTQCTRPDCTFYHPTINVPPRHALKWIRPQTSE
ncbi:ZC3H14 isoform 2 [Pan troglodytes]|uniref:Zinc finger CCCH domain-containing protein 14 n=6 Tax=Homininae TaxID=207598 RepID=A0A6D2VWY1_PANTR|nr:zinc finger CCCH domain-containing protein 14 isoform 2 [Homo sapiens]XP_008956416.1 zinc finger CCCH domain-containing protein 14 isoform X13 [Pan paniscus]XP_016782057.1 zinc finger CCCH domain-containing protein 14 isoform X9 [Pan troglodytes]AAS90300.1 putative NY-REN-37 antigen isoform 2 [Homo sapiens]EAW81385.1 nuclear protein UKp68, isoform CRA_b [Homo sapiens]KAI2572305.1 zinc finger CCCH-type containing 14 [Homo sapiens]KAI4061927.1 zinc finger CCCH-type containing 14 [Homo sapien|eukprot:NP_997543.1 zinc finger CCCH domain-containing protein 14 isoform 2 [Homo sapiens]